MRGGADHFSLSRHTVSKQSVRTLEVNMSSVDIERLVSSVFSRPAIWDISHEAHHNRFILDKLWQEVALETGCSKVNVKSKWKYLRDNFRKELAKQPKCQSGLGADMTNIRSSWPYFTSLLFLKDQFGLKKPPSSNAEYNPVDEDVSEMLEVSYDDPDMQQGNALLPLPSPSGSYYGESSNDEPCASKNPFKRRKTNMPELSEDFLNGEKQKFKEPKEKCSKKSEEESNEDLKFFESLLPHVKKISSHQKLLLRSRMLDLVQQYAYNSAQSSGFQSPRSNASPQTTVNQD